MPEIVVSDPGPASCGGWQAGLAIPATSSWLSERLPSKASLSDFPGSSKEIQLPFDLLASDMPGHSPFSISVIFGLLFQAPLDI